jgi:hypothetical protein
MDTYFGKWWHTWVEIVVWQRGTAEPILRHAVGLAPGEAEAGKKAGFRAKDEALNRPHSFAALIPFRSTVNHFTLDAIGEVAGIAVRIMHVTGDYTLTSNNCRTFVNIFLYLFLGESNLCNTCMGIVAGTTMTVAYFHKYLMPHPFHMKYVGWYTAYYEVHNRTLRATDEANFGRVTAINKSGAYTPQEISDMETSYK